ncbi:MAG TPA: TonB-dependent receptor plug domain-containing protein, partial [Magnetospirillaceae bacterium]|nr:TonB-dependent receptor plug domain-containing protein [Magnetospirillaceae bacterium]
MHGLVRPDAYGTGRRGTRKPIGVAISTLCLAMLLPAFAQAQTSSEEITITGSRIRAPNLVSDSPVSAVNATDIAESNVQNIEEVLNHLPAVTTSITQQQSSLVGGTTANVNLRALGVNRTLSLIDGHRIGPSDTSAAADLNILPTTILSGVDVLTGGASAVYGSDAVAGVVNFHIIKDLQGAIANFSYSGYLHDNNNSVAQSLSAHSPFPISPATGTSWDGFTRESSGAVGANFAENKGNVMVYADYRSTSAVLNEARDYNICAAAPGVANRIPYATCT